MQKLPELKCKIRIIKRKKNKLVETRVLDNLIVDRGKKLILDALRNYGAGLQYIALGTGTTPPSSSDTQLEQERVRKSFTEIKPPSETDLEITFTAFLGSDEPPTTYDFSEIGLFGTSQFIATSEPNSGQLFNRASIDPPLTKVAGEETLTIEVSFYY